MSERFQRRVVAKTAAYTLNFPFDASGTIFTNRGAGGSVTFTLPSPNRGVMGRWYEFRQHADQTLIVAGATAGDLATTGNAAANNVSFPVGSAKVGRGLMAVCDGTQWLCYPIGTGSGFSVNGTEVVATFASGVALTAPVIAGGTSTAQEVVTTIAGDGAITIATGIVVLTKGSAAAITLAASTAVGTRITIVAGSAWAHVVTATGLLDDGITGGSKNTATFGAFVGSAITLIVAQTGKWAVESKNVVTVA
jgi:hypothetical protein